MKISNTVRAPLNAAPVLRPLPFYVRRKCHFKNKFCNTSRSRTTSLTKKSQAIEINPVNSLFVYFSFFENNAINLLFVCLFFMNLINFKYTIIIIA